MEVELSAAHLTDDPAALQALALISLVGNDPRGTALDSAVSLLRQAAELSDTPAPYLADLSAALLVRAERAQAPRDILEANETAEHALQLDPRNAIARYNHALALDRFGLVDETIEAWRGYLAVDSTSGWADEANRRIQLLRSISPPPPPAANAPEPAYAAYALADAQGARELGMDHLLGEWGAAVEAGDSATAADRLRRAAWLGDALLRRPGGDASLADMVRAIRATTDPAQLRTLARAHRAYAEGQRLYDALDFGHALTPFTASERAAGGSPALLGWARVYLGSARIRTGDREGGLRLLRDVTRVSLGRLPALEGRAKWSLARTVGLGESWEQAFEDSRQSARLFGGAGEVQSAGMALDILSDIHFLFGEPDSAYLALHRSLDGIKMYRGSARLHNRLLTAARAAANDGLLRSAVDLQAEGVAVARRTGSPPLLIEAQLQLSRLLTEAGDASRAGAAVEATRPVVAALTDPGARSWFEADLRSAEGLVELRTDPSSATRKLDSAAVFFHRAVGPFRELPIMVASAQSRLFAGDEAGAMQRFERAVKMLEERRDSIRMEPRRAAVFDAARDVLDRIVLLKLARGQVSEALDYMDRGRASLATTGRGTGTAPLPLSFPGEVAIEYARVADTLLTWTAASGRAEVARTVVDSVQLQATITRLQGQMERGASEQEVRPALSQLYDILIRPIAVRLAPGTPVVIVCDGEIAAVPFAALYDGQRGRYVVEDHALRFAVSFREAAGKPLASAAPGVLLIGDPAFNARSHALLARLPKARQEVHTIAREYPRVSILEGSGATRQALVRAFAAAGVIHFAGHAVFDDQRPEQSFLLVAPDGSNDQSDRITAADLARLDLRRVRLVILSACRTVRTGPSRSKGFSGIAGALLAAGAAGTIASGWDVDDARTSMLMKRFHREYSGGRSARDALREAQLAMLSSPVNADRSPAAWAGFRYVGQ